MRRNGGGAACWGVFREVEHSPNREADDAAILEATGRRLEQFGFSVVHRLPQSLDAAETSVPPLVFAMCEGPSALEVLGRWERRGVRVVNGTRAIVNTHRERSLRLLAEHGVPMPESRLLDGNLPLPRGAAEALFYSACWVKQASEHKTREGEVRFATDADSVQEALDRLRARGLTRAIVQRHVEGDMVKFYGVGGFDSVGGAGSSGASWFRWFYPKEHPVEGHRFNPSALRDIACRAAEALELEVWGGDAIVTPRGDIFVIDVNAWPSFSLFRDEAAGHIAARLAARVRRLTDAAEPFPATLVLMKAGGRPSAAGTSLLGLPLLRRTALAARRAGYDRVWVAGREDAGAILEGTGAVVLPLDGTPPPLPPGRIVLMPDDVVGSSGWLRRLREVPVPDDRLCPVGPGAVVEVERPELLARAVADAPGLPEALAAWGAVLPPGPSPDVEPPVVLASKRDVPVAERLLLRELVKPEDGFLTRHISRKISLAVTRLLAKTSISPNAMTLFCTLLGLAAAWCFGSSVALSQCAGGILFLLHSILDGCDGELARLKFMESRLGGTLDFWGDNLVHVAVFSAFAYSWSAAVDDPWPLQLGALAVGGTIAAAALVYFHAMRRRPTTGPLLTTVSPTHRSKLTERLDEASRRDFIYLVWVLSLFGKAYWFLALAAIGTPIFALSLLFVATVGVRRTSVPAESGAFQ
jgi:1L-myo-inositol 1-phosphate cytidylyltransferase / CDP-L-myo-inositol myo-inositolphosphotransferase